MSDMDGNSTPEQEGPPLVSWPADRLLVIGSDAFSIPEAIPRALVNWWHAHNTPQVILVTDDSQVGAIAQSTFDSEKFGVELHERDPQLPYPSRSQFRQMVLTRPTHAFVFQVAGDLAIEARVLALYAQSIPTTVITIEELIVQ
jgi:hypothetical protein